MLATLVAALLLAAVGAGVLHRLTGEAEAPAAAETEEAAP
jgi:hypothetical protein